MGSGADGDTRRWRARRSQPVRSRLISAPGVIGARCRTKASWQDEQGRSGVEVMWVTLIAAILVTISVPTFFKTSVGATDIDAKANLQVAVVAARSSYEIQQAYSYQGIPLSTIALASAAPEFAWTTGSCANKGPACVSEQVVDVNNPGDAQGLVLANWSSSSSTCWYAMDLESVPRVLTDDHSGQALESGSTGVSGSVSDAGIYYARSAAGVSTCKAESGIDTSDPVRWEPYSP
jgi:Tfp pilus assembly protein PilE